MIKYIKSRLLLINAAVTRIVIPPVTEEPEEPEPSFGEFTDEFSDEFNT